MSKEARNNVSVNAMETFKKPDGIAEEKWSKVINRFLPTLKIIN